MGGEFTLNTMNFGDGFTWEHAEKMIEKEFGFRLPTIGESIMMCFEHQAIWTSEEINGKHLVMDNQYGAQVIREDFDIKVGLVLVEK